MEQQINPHWPNMVEGYAWMLQCTQLDIPVTQLIVTGDLRRIDAIMATTLVDLIRDVVSSHPELNRRLNDQLLDCRKAALDIGKTVTLTGRQIYVSFRLIISPRGLLM